MTPPEAAAAVRFIGAARPADRAGDRPRLRPGPQARQPLPADRPVRRHPPRLARASGLYRTDTRLLSCSVLRVGGERPVLLQGSMGGNYRGAIQLTNPSRRPQPGHEGPPARRPRRADDRDLARPADRRRGARGAAPDRQPREPRRSRSRSSSTWVPTTPTSSRCAAIREPARGTLLPVAVTRTASRSATTAWTACGAARTSPSRSRRPRSARSRRCRPIRSTPARRCGCAGTWSSSRGAVGELQLDGLGRTIAPDPARTPPPSPTRRRSSPSRRSCRATRARPRTAPGSTARRPSTATTSCSTSRCSARSPTCGCSSTTARDRASATSRPACRGSRRCSAATRSSPRSSRSPSGRSSRSRRSTVLAAYQATEVDDRRDAEPGKILHELRTGEMAGAGELPHTPYYGSVDSTPLWLILLGATFDWTGDRALLDRLWPNALAALDWIDRYGDRDGDGFVEYERRSERGLLNQGWKDSSDADPRPARRRVRRRRSPSPRSRATSSTRSGGWPAWPAIRGDDALADRLEADARDAAAALRGRVLGRGPALLRDGARRRQAPGRRDRLERRALPLDRDRRRRSARGRRRPAARPGDVLRLGHPDLRVGPARLQPDRLPHRARSGRTTRR